MPPELLLDALIKAGATLDDEDGKVFFRRITKADMFTKGLSGKTGSAELRKKLQKKLELPERLTADGLLDVLNATMDRDTFYALEL